MQKAGFLLTLLILSYSTALFLTVDFLENYSSCSDFKQTNCILINEIER